MNKATIVMVATVALFATPAWAENSCEKPDPTDTVTKSDVGELHQKPLGVADFTDAKGKCTRLMFFAGSPQGIVFASDVAQTVAIVVDTNKNTLIVLREDGKDVTPE